MPEPTKDPSIHSEYRGRTVWWFVCQEDGKVYYCAIYGAVQYNYRTLKGLQKALDRVLPKEDN